MKKEAMLYEKLSDDSVHCFLCSHHCRIHNNEFGFCGVRQNIDQILYTHVYGAAIVDHVDPVEKKTLYHFLPGSLVYSIGTVECNFHCGFCQNWQVSQASDMGRSRADFGKSFTPNEVVGAALAHRCQSIAYTYTEPTIFFEYAYDTAELARQKGLRNIFVTNGYLTDQTLETVAVRIDAVNVDLKSWRDTYYRDICSSKLQPVLNTIRHMKMLGIWVEITTLLISEENDTQKDLEGIAGFIAEVNVDIPWHISAFHPSYTFKERSPTAIGKLVEAGEVGRKAGLRNIYLDNIPTSNHTFCLECGKMVIEREGRAVNTRGLMAEGFCNACGAYIPGVWR